MTPIPSDAINGIYTNQWNKTWSTVNWDEGHGIWTDGTTIYTCGYTYRNGFAMDVLLIKWDAATGNQLWNRTWGGTGNDYGCAVWANASVVFICGNTSSYGAGGSDMVLLKYTSSGTFTWYRTWGYTSSESGYALWGDGAGNLFGCGTTTRYDADGDLVLVKWVASSGTLLYARTWGGTLQDYGNSVWGNGTVVFTSGYTNSYGAGGRDILLVKWNAIAGTQLWNHTWGGTNEDTGYGLWANNSAAFVCGSSFNALTGNVDLALVKFDAITGTPAWNSTWGGPGPDVAYSLWGDASSIFTLGTTKNLSVHVDDVAMIRWNAKTGQKCWNITWGGDNVDYGYFITGDNADSVFTCGTRYEISSAMDLVVMKWSYVDVNPVANFAANQTYIVVNGDVNFSFTGVCENQPAMYIWNFGDGTGNQTALNPVHRFAATGNYTVNLTVVDADADASTMTKANYIVVVSRPAAPRNLSRVAGNGFVFLQWEAPSNDGNEPITSYKIYRGIHASNESVLITLGNVIDFNDTRLMSGIQYYYFVTAVNVIGESDPSLEVNGISTGVPSPPRAIGASSGNSFAALTWLAPGNNGGSPITNYIINRGTSSGDESYLATIGNITFFNDTSVSNGNPYFFTVIAVNSLGNSSPSLEIGVMPSTNTHVTAPRNLSAIAGNRWISLSWQEPSSNNGSAIMNYNIYRSLSSGAEMQVATIGNVTSFNDTGLTNGLCYYYQVAAFNGVSVGVRSNETCGIPVSVPAMPRNILAQPGNRHINLTWNVPASSGGQPITNYIIFRGYSLAWMEARAIIGNVTTFQDTGLVNGLSYYYRVSAMNCMGQGSNTSAILAIPATTPSTPLGLVVNQGVEHLLLSWQVPSINGGRPITGYKIYQGIMPGAEVLLDTVGNITVYDDVDLDSGQRYYYTVVAVNEMGDSDPSVEASNVSLGPPQPPSSLLATGNQGFILVTWQVPSNNGGIPITGYRIYRGTSSGGENFLSTLGNVTIFNDTTAMKGIRHYYIVSALNSIGEGGNSTESNALATGTPFAPLIPLATGGWLNISLSWQMPSNTGGYPVTGYKIYRGNVSSSEICIATIANTTAYNDNGLAAGHRYYYKITALNSLGESAFSVELNSVALGISSAPFAVYATPGNRSASLIWELPQNTGGMTITNYTIYRGDYPGGESYLTTIGSARSYTDTNVTNGLRYYYQISAINDFGESIPSTEINAIPADTPSSPLNLRANNINERVVLTWSPPLTNGGSVITGYRIYRGETPESMSIIATIDTVTTYTDEAVSLLKTYYYTIVAVNIMGEGLHSETVEVKTVSAGSGGIAAIIVVGALGAIGSLIVVSMKNAKKKKMAREKESRDFTIAQVGKKRKVTDVKQDSTTSLIPDADEKAESSTPRKKWGTVN
nr:fibronectin type III domain-containing protein [Candidatus Sigynarchaeota archaeon]